MTSRLYHYCLIAALLLTFLVKAIAPFYGVLNAPAQKDPALTELQRIFGNSVLICAATEKNGIGEFKFGNSSGKKHAPVRHCPLCAPAYSDSATYAKSTTLHFTIIEPTLHSALAETTAPYRYDLKHTFSQAPPANIA